MEAMQKISAEALPQAVLNHIAAHNDHDPDAFMATLAPDALVNDAKREVPRSSGHSRMGGQGDLRR
jgi:hypothetical protein